MASIVVRQLKPQAGTLRITHPFLTKKVEKLDDKGNVVMVEKKRLILDENEKPVEETYEEPLIIDVPVDTFDLPDGTQGPLELYIVGRNSPQWLEFMKKIKSSAQKEYVDIFSLIEKEGKEFVASMIVGWLDNGAIDTPYSNEAAFEILSNPENLWIVEQIQKFIIDERNFFLKM
jgi:hypothetical protein